MSIFDPVYRDTHVSGQIARILFSISQAIKHMLWEKSKLENLTPAQIQVLLYINFVRSDSVTVNSLARHLSCTPATVSGILDVLQGKDLVERNRKSDDRRKVILSLTPKGSRTVEVVQDVGNDIEDMISEFNEEEQEILERLLLKMSKKLIVKKLINYTDFCLNCSFFHRSKYPDSFKPHYCDYLNIFLSEVETYKECPDYRDTLN